MRTLLTLLLLAVPVIAGPGSWKAIRYGADETEPGTPGKVTGNAMMMEVIAHAVYTGVSAMAMTDPLSANEDGTGSASDTVWYEMRFVGDSGATNLSWSIESSIRGQGDALADVCIQGSAWGESIEVISVTGDNTNSGVGQLAVTDSGSTKISLSAPPRVTVSLTQTMRSEGSDNYVVKKLKKTTGPGGKCRIRVETDAKAQAVARTIIGHASVSLIGYLHVDLEMKGICTFGSIRITDTFRIGPGGVITMSASGTTPPTGGVETRPGEIPTDDPADDEPEGDPDTSTTDSDVTGGDGGNATSTEEDGGDATAK